ncbi:MAG TPA: polysaccharide deacetylase family protein [Mariniphaga sp.]|nr:polysaccharide deacetylase family protein [Mariniphaga sp.]
MILIYTEKLNPRIEYIFQVIFTVILGKQVSFTSKMNKFITSPSPKINYSYEKFGAEIYIKPHRLLYCKALIQPDIQPVWHEGEKYFFESSSDSVFPFDMFAASFYLLSRYEEYLDGEKDKFKRFPASESILVKYNLLKKPVVNIWARMLADKLKEYFPELDFPKKTFRFVPTIDIDNAWAYAHKGSFRTAGAVVRALANGNLQEVRSRMNVWLGRIKDPYDTYGFMDEVFKGHEKDVVFFFLLGNYKRYDKNISWENKKFRELIRDIGARYQIGIHPSYSSSKKKNKSLLAAEVKRLHLITGKTVNKSRQHFLRLRFPRVYRNLIKNGIQEDYTMGYPSHSGFRAGICTPYPFYDLKNEAITSLTIMPFQVMDVTLRVYLKLSPADALKEIEGLMEEVKNVGGTFSYIWHNETINDVGDWKGYREVFQRMNELGFNWIDADKKIESFKTA